MKFVKRTIVFAQDGSGAACNFKTNKLGKLKRQLADLLKQVLRGTPAATQLHLWNKCRKTGPRLLSCRSCSEVLHATQTPSNVEIQQLLDAVNCALQQEATNARREREKVWKEMFANDWAEGGTTCCAWCKGESNDRAEMISRPDGSLTCDSEEMDSLVRNAWLPVFQMYTESPPPNRHYFQSRFGTYVVEKLDMQFQTLEGCHLWKTLRRMKSKSAAACDGWRVDEIKRLPVPLLDRD